MLQYRLYGREPLPASLEGLVKAAANTGSVIGQFLFGHPWSAPRLRERAVAYLIIITTIHCLTTPTGSISPNSSLIYLGIFRILLGVGVGGDYPMSAIVASDRAAIRRRGTMLSYTFANQGWGSFAGSIVTMIVLLCYKSVMQEGKTSRVDGVTPVAGQAPSSYAPGGVPRPDVQAWIERARESIQAIGAFMEGEEDIEEEDEDEEGEATYDGEEGYFDEQNGEQQWREPAGEQDTDTEEGDIVVEGPDGADHSDERRSVRQASPATTVRSASREGSAPPQFGPRTQNQGQGAGRGGRRRTPQPARLAPLPATPAAPLKLIADLSLRSGNNRQGSKSPKSASLLGMSSHSRASSIEVDSPSSATVGCSSPKSMGAVTEKPRAGGSDAGAQAQAEVAQEATSDGESQT